MIEEEKEEKKLEVLAFEEFATDNEDFKKKLINAFLRAEVSCVTPSLIRCTKVAYEAIVSELEVFDKDEYPNILENYYYRVDPHYFEGVDLVGSLYGECLVVVLKEDEDEIFEGEYGVLMNSYDKKNNKSYITIINKQEREG